MCNAMRPRRGYGVSLQRTHALIILPAVHVLLKENLRNEVAIPENPQVLAIVY